MVEPEEDFYWLEYLADSLPGIKSFIVAYPCNPCKAELTKQTLGVPVVAYAPDTIKQVLKHMRDAHGWCEMDAVRWIRNDLRLEKK